MASQPTLTFQSNINPFNSLTSLTFIQSKLGSGALPVLHGENSNPVLFRIYNNFVLANGIATAMNVNITTFDATGVHTASTSPVSQSWLHVMENGFGENSVLIPDLYTRYSGMDTPVGGSYNTYFPEKGSNGQFSIPQIRAGSNTDGAGYIEVKSYTSIPDPVIGGNYTFVITVIYEYTS